MSADLWAAFGSPKQESNSHVPKKADTLNTQSGAADRSQDSWILQSRPIPHYSTKPSNSSLWKQDEKGADVLFDASDDERDTEDFGDFEAPPSKEQVPLPANDARTESADVDLLGLNDLSCLHVSHSQKYSYNSSSNAPTTLYASSRDYDSSSQTFQPYPHDLSSSGIWDQPNSSIVNEGSQESRTRKLSSVDDEWGNFEDVATESTPNPGPGRTTDHSASHQEASSTNINDEEEWEAFEDGPPTSTPPRLTSALTHDPSTAPTKTSTQPLPPPYSPAANHARPTNIPPPSTLLQLLPQIYTTLSTQSRLPTPPLTLAHHTLQILTTTAHLISGRHHRWKRDTHLSQSTRISQAGLKNTGMKLTALDKSLTVKEDQDVADTIAAWQRHASALNAVMLKAKVAKPSGALGVSMPVRTASGPGVLGSKECCAVCGLRRNERVNGIDTRVDDTFGEWWVEFWGHRDCYEFWYTYEGLLSRR